jgi:hypothetical protein
MLAGEWPEKGGDRKSRLAEIGCRETRIKNTGNACE